MKLFFITGHGRSGTHYMAKLFSHFGFKVGPQSDGKDGQSHNFPPFWPFKNARKQYKYLIQVVRNPWKVIESTFLAEYFIPDVYSGKRVSQARIPELKEGTRLERTIKSVVLWNRAICEAEPDLVVKVENAPEVCREWLTKNGLPVSANGTLPPTTINARRSGSWNLGGEVPWNDASDKVYSMLREHCQRYGYPKQRT